MRHPTAPAFRIALAAVLATVLAATFAPRASADELFRQNPFDSVGGYSSQDARNTNGLGWFSEVADNFTATSPWTIGSVEFWGGYVTVVPGNTHGFTIRFYADNDTSPGALLSSQDVFAFSETVYYTFPAPQLWNGYHYSVTLPSAVQLPSAGAYWISVVAILDRGGSSTEPQWGWAQAQTFDPPLAQQWFFSATHAFAPLQGNAAFVLNSSAGATGVCCRGATCTTSITTAAACAAALPIGSAAGATFATAPTCNAPGNTVSPCCYADYNKSGMLSAQDIFDFLHDWFAASPLSRTGSDGSSAPLSAQNIFDFLGDWFAGGC